MADAFNFIFSPLSGYQLGTITFVDHPLLGLMLELIIEQDWLILFFMSLPGFLIGSCGYIFISVDSTSGYVSSKFPANGTLVHADNFSDFCLCSCHTLECFNLVPLLQGELIILLCHVVITKVVFRLFPFGASLRFGYAFASLRPERGLSLLHLLVEPRKYKISLFLCLLIGENLYQ